MRNDFSVNCEIWQDRYSSLTIQLCINHAAFLKVESIKCSFKSALQTHQWNTCRHITQQNNHGKYQWNVFCGDFLYVCSILSICLSSVCCIGRGEGDSSWARGRADEGTSNSAGSVLPDERSASLFAQAWWAHRLKELCSLHWGLAGGAGSTSGCSEPLSSSGSSSNSQLQAVSSLRSANSLCPGCCTLHLLRPRLWRNTAFEVALHVLWGQKLFTVACDSHVSFATPCPEGQPSVILVPLAEDTVRSKGVYVQGLCIEEVEMCVRGGEELPIRNWSCRCSHPKDKLLAAFAHIVSSDLLVCWLSHSF